MPVRVSSRRIAAAAVAAVVAVGLFVAGVLVGGHPEASGINRLPDGLRSALVGDSGRALPDQVLDVLQKGYYTDVDRRKLERASVDGIIAALGDPYTRYLSPEELTQAREQAEGEYSGVGIRIARGRDAVVVSSVFPGGPAQRAGVRVGDRIMAVDGKAVRGPDLDGVVSGIKGPAGTTVRVRLRRAGRDAPIDLALKRETIAVPVVSSRLVGPAGRRVAYVRLDQFTRGSAKAVRDAVQGLLDRGARAVVLDLRGDPGGLVDEAVGVASVFLPKGSPVVTTVGRHEPRTTLKARGNAIDEKVPLVVLVNRDSASSSEIVAGALRDSGRARLVGTRTYGKALVQTTRLLPGGGAVKLTTARYLTPKGIDIARRGVQPTLRVQDDPGRPGDEVLVAGVREALAAPGR